MSPLHICRNLDSGEEIVLKSDLVKLYSKFNKKYFDNQLTCKISIQRLSYLKSDHYAHYFPSSDEICFFHWVMQERKTDIICTLLHEMVHASFKSKIKNLNENPLVQSIEYHDRYFAQKLYDIYKQQFSGKQLENVMTGEIWIINNEESDMHEALKYFGIGR
jgi:hypothetical protein